MEKMEFSSCDFDCVEKVEPSNSNFQNLLVSSAKSEHNILCQERSDTLPSEVETGNESNQGVLDTSKNALPIEDNKKNASIANCVSSNEFILNTDDHTCEILKQNPVKNDKIGKVNSGDDIFVDSKLIGKNYESLNVFNPHTCVEENISDLDSVSSEESSDHDFLVIHEGDAAALTFDSSDASVICANEEPVKTVTDGSEALRDELESCAIHEDCGKVHTDKHASSEIKERVMSYLNKQSMACESGIKEQECNKLLAMDGTTTNKEAVTGENKSLTRMEEVASSLNSIGSSVPATNDKPIKCDMISFNSPMEVNAKWDPTESPLKKPTSPLLFHGVGLDVTSHSSGMRLVQPILSVDMPCQTSNRICEEMVEGNNSSTEHCIKNNDMELNNSSFEETVCTIDSVASVTLSTTTIKASAPDVYNGGTSKTIDCNSFSSETMLCSQKDPVNLSERDNSKCFSSPTFPKMGSDATFINESFQPCYKSGTILTNSSLSSWGKLSFQPLTTSSINCPIFSSKTSNEENLSDSESRIPCPQFKDPRSGTVKTFAILSHDESKSRKTKSSEALFCSQSFPPSSNSLFCENIAGETSPTLSNINFNRPPVLAESSWSVNSLTKRTVIGGEKSSSNFTPIDSPLIRNSSIGSLSVCQPFKKFPDNPFSKMPSESIGIFSSSQETRSNGFPTIFKPVASSVSFSPKREKLSGRISVNSKDSMNITFSENKETGLFSFNKTSERQDDKQKNSTVFSFTHCDNLNTAKKFAFNPSSVSKLEKKNSVSSHEHEHAGSQFLVNPASFQFQNKNEKSKGSNPHRLSRLVRKSCKQYDRGISNLFKEANMLTTHQVDLSYTPFKPSYGSDVMWDKSGTKNVMVRYQNIAFMKEHLNVSPEELRANYYYRTHAIGPFKFCASSEYSKNLCHKKIFSKEVQTDENLISKKYELTEIWRALECPVCLDVVMPPVYQCQQGHHACLTCWNKVVTCPLCKQRKSVTRNYMAEALIDQIPLPCKYHIEGCKETVCRTNKISHEETCSYRMYQCPVPLCNQAHSYLNMCAHFKKVHKSVLHHEGHSVGKGEKFCDVLYKDHLSSSLIHAFDIAKWGLFFLREHSKRSRALFIQVMPASPEPAAYFYHLEVSDHHDCRKECYKGRVFCMGKSIQEIIDEEEYLSLSELILKTVKKTAPLKIVVTIWQLKPAFTLSAD